MTFPPVDPVTVLTDPGDLVVRRFHPGPPVRSEVMEMDPRSVLVETTGSGLGLGKPEKLLRTERRGPSHGVQL